MARRAYGEHETYPGLLLNYFQSREQKWFRVSTVFLLTSRRTEIATSVSEPNLKSGNFGDLITADHKVLSEGCESRHNHRYAVAAQDLATQWIQSYPCKTKTSQETEKSLQKFLEPDRET